MTYTGLFERAYTGICRDAAISPCTRYRYTLKRWWDDDQSKPWACWIMLNPSTADAARDDATIRKIIKFSRAWGMAGLYVVNLFAWRETDSSKLKSVKDAVGVDNDWWIRQAVILCQGPIVAAWGAKGSMWGRDSAVMSLIEKPLMCLRVTKNGCPEHPLYIPDATTLIEFKSAGVP